MPTKIRYNIVVTRDIPHGAIDRLREVHDVTVYDEGPDAPLLDEKGLISLARDADALITMLSDPVTEGVIRSCPRLKVIAQYAVGFDNIDVDAAEENGIIVTHTPDVLTDATADMAFALLLALARRIPEADDYVRAGKFKRWETMDLLGRDLCDKVLGIVGMGRIGTAVAKRGLGFGMQIRYFGRRRLPISEEYRYSARYVDFDHMLEESDIITIHCPLNAESRGLFDSKAFDRMKRSAFLINTARGPIVDEDALVNALNDGRIAGAGLDVFEDEPNVHPGLIESDRVIMAPHLGSATKETRWRMAEMCVDSILAILNEADYIPYRVPTKRRVNV